MVARPSKTMIERIKWIGTIILFIGTAINSLGHWPQGPIILIAGGILWTTAAYLERDVPLFVTNIMLEIVSMITLIYTLFQK
jgi:hypothetical protein